MLSTSGKRIYNQIEEQGKDVVLFAHSYGAHCGGLASAGLAKAVRKEKGDRGGIVGLIYLAGVTAPEGSSVMGLLNNQWPRYMKVDQASLKSRTNCVSQGQAY